MSRESWVGLESNPEVMTQYAHKLGVHEDWCFVDVLGLDDASLRLVPQPCVGAIFLYPYRQCEARKRSLGRCRGAPLPHVWFMKQRVGNACGAVALMHTVMNNLRRTSTPKGFLESFHADTARASAAERADMFAPAVRELHSSLAPRGQTDAPAPTADLDFHFVSLVAVGGRLYELDGNNDGPIECGEVPHPDEFLRAAVRHVAAAYVAPFPDSHFSMMALVPKLPG
ncbi:hypothetical protein AB1Y20_002873 [Prymnesium parvum]|uniref:Ubiquitin carboxyl-terminal hydrolase n=1 Tax=Prymnesium parvum TaxID=97485 RepID=A0AB34JAC5_PRYPA